MKTEKEIEEIANKYVEEMGLDENTGYRLYSYIHGYSQAKKDMLAEASESFEEWEKLNHFERCHGLQTQSAKQAWIASRISMMKENELKDLWVKHHQKTVEIKCEEVASLTQEVKKLREELNHALYLAAGIHTYQNHEKVLSECERIRTKFKLDGEEK